MTANRPHPLLPHGILLIVVGAVLLIAGAWGSASNLRSLFYTSRSVRAPTLSPTANPYAAAAQARNLAYMVRRLASVGALILAGGATLAAGIGVLKRRDWARYLGFGGLGFGVVYFAGQQGVWAAGPGVTAAIPIALVLIVAAGLGKPLFDLAVESFEAA